MSPVIEALTVCFINSKQLKPIFNSTAKRQSHKIYLFVFFFHISDKSIGTEDIPIENNKKVSASVVEGGNGEKDVASKPNAVFEQRIEGKFIGSKIICS